MPSDLLPGIEADPGGNQTTHFSVLDANVELPLSNRTGRGLRTADKFTG
jgi:hypothetical protein